MKCPACKSEKFYKSNHDREIICCEDCHHITSTTHASGFWIGYIEAQSKYKEQLKALYDAIYDRRMGWSKKILEKLDHEMTQTKKLLEDEDD